MALSFDDLDDLDTAVVRSPSYRVDAAPAPVLTVPCPGCRGTGQFVSHYGNSLGACRVCKGTGKVRADWKKRSDAHKKGERTKAENRRASDRGFEFATNMEDAVAQYGSLTDRQLAAVRNCIAKDAARIQQAEQNATQISGANAIVTALQTAKGNGYKSPKLRTEHATFSLAPDHGNNAGFIYVKNPDSDYLGKISATGAFYPSRDCSDVVKSLVAKVAENALSAAVEYGRKSGVCSCCGRELTDPASIAAGIGPICASKFF